MIWDGTLTCSSKDLTRKHVYQRIEMGNTLRERSQSVSQSVSHISIIGSLFDAAVFPDIARSWL